MIRATLLEPPESGSPPSARRDSNARRHKPKTGSRSIALVHVGSPLRHKNSVPVSAAPGAALPATFVAGPPFFLLPAGRISPITANTAFSPNSEPEPLTQ